MPECQKCPFLAKNAFTEFFHPLDLRFSAPDFFAQCIYTISIARKNLVTCGRLVGEKKLGEWYFWAKFPNFSPLSYIFNETSLLEVRLTPEQKGKMRH